MQSMMNPAAHEAPIAQIVQDVVQTMLGYDVALSQEDFNFNPDTVTAAIFLAGSWHGAVTLECSRKQAFAFTGRLMGIPDPTVLNDDVRDALGEIVNMVGGNLKSLLPAGVGLSIPSVVHGSDYAYMMCGTNRHERRVFRGELGLFRITLV